MNWHLQQNRSQGFTLLEMLMVLTLVGLLASMVVPNIARQIKVRTLESERQEILKALTLLPLHAMNSGQTVQVQGPLAGPLNQPFNVPEGWLVDIQPVLVITSSPSCNAVSIRIARQQNDEPERQYRIEPTTCALKIATTNEPQR